MTLHPPPPPPPRLQRRRRRLYEKEIYSTFAYAVLPSHPTFPTSGSSSSSRISNNTNGTLIRANGPSHTRLAHCLALLYSSVYMLFSMDCQKHRNEADLLRILFSFFFLLKKIVEKNLKKEEDSCQKTFLYHLSLFYICCVYFASLSSLIHLLLLF
jgi:hypothetical protein